MITSHKKYKGDCMKLIPRIDARYDLVIADPPYSKPKIINPAIELCKEYCDGACFFFMYAEDVFDLEYRPDQILHWVKPPSTKNTTKRYSRFVEVICVYDLAKSPFRQDTYWFTRSGLFQDIPTRTTEHPHKKPEGLIEKLLAVNSKVGDFVLDPFSGSGTVSKVCKRMNRNSISIEEV